MPFASGRIFAFFFLVVLAREVDGQITAFANPVQNEVLVFDRTPAVLRRFTGLGGSRHLACDGVDRVWVTLPAELAVARLEVGSGVVARHYLSAEPAGIALTEDGGVVVAVKSGSAGGELARFGPDGARRWTVSCPADPTLVTVDGKADIWVTHQSPGASSLARYDAQGTLLSLHPVGVSPVELFAARDGVVWVHSFLSGELHRYSEEGQLLAVLQLGFGASDFAFDRRGALWFVRPLTREVELRDVRGESPVRLTVPAAFDVIALDAADGVWGSESGTGTVTRHAPLLTASASVIDQIGVRCIGDQTGLAWAGAAGAALDPDGDGVSSGHELDADTDPFDPTSVPMELAPLAPLVPGAFVPLRVGSRGTPRGLYWLGAAFKSAPPGSGPFGFPLCPDHFFHWHQQNAAGLLPSLVGAFDGAGEALTLLHLPPTPGFGGITTSWAFLAFRRDDLTTGIPSPVLEIVLP